MDKPLKFFLIITFIFVSLISVFLLATFMKKPAENKNTISVNEQNPLIARAKQEAAATLDSLIVLQKLHPNKTFVRFSFEPIRDHTEHLWGKAVSLDTLNVKIELLRKGELEEVYYPDDLELHLDRIEDWLVELPDGNIRGGFTSQAILLLDKQKSDASHSSIDSQLNMFIDRFPGH